MFTRFSLRIWLFMFSAIALSEAQQNYYPVNRPRNINGNYQRRPSDDTASASSSGTTSDEINAAEFLPEKYKYLVGFDASTATLGVFGTQNIVVGLWNNDIGFELLSGFNKSEDNLTSNVIISNDVLANSGNTVTSYEDSKTNACITLGAVLKSRVFQNRWLQIYAGGFLGVNGFLTTDYPVGTKREVYTDLSNTSNRTVTETSLGSVKVERGMQLALGPKIGAEFYLKWFPHLAIGFSTGIAAYFGGATKTTTSARSRSYTVVNNVEQPATEDNTLTTVNEVSPGVKGVTFGVGGTTFQFNGIFTLRYVW